MRKQIHIEKAVAYSIIINTVQVAAVVGIALFVLITKIEKASVVFVEFIICLAAAVVIWGAVVDIHQAISARQINEQSTMLKEAYRQLESLNFTLRSQRHDFMNHLQVVSSLIEMEEYVEASRYIEQIHGDIHAVSAVLHTGNPAVNALLKAKMGESQRRGVFLDIHTHSKWSDLPMQGWEMCRVLGNLIDNALDALAQTKAPLITLTLAEEPFRFTFALLDNGPQIPDSIRGRIFEPGFTTKGEGHGMGLSIVQRLMRQYGGEITLESTEKATVFHGWLPKSELPSTAEEFIAME